MRPLLVSLAGLCASVATSLVVWLAVSGDTAPYYEALDGSLVRTTASDADVSAAIERALQVVRPHRRSAAEALEHCGYRERAEAWFSAPDLFGQSHERASRHSRVQADRSGRRIEVEVFRGEGMPTLVFVRHDDPERAAEVTSCLASELANLGAVRR